MSAEQEKPRRLKKENRKEIYTSMLAYAKPHGYKFLAVLFFSFFAIFADLLQPYLVKIAIDDHLNSGAEGTRMLIILGLFYLLLAAFSMLFSYLQAVVLQKIGQSIVAHLRKDLFKHITNQSMSFFDTNPMGSLVTNESSDTETISQFFTSFLLSVVRDGLSLVLILAFMFYLDVELAMYCLLLLPMIALITAAFSGYLRNAYQRARTQLSNMIAFIAENLSGMGLIQMFHQEKEQIARFEERNGSYLFQSIKEIRATVIFNRTFDVLSNVALAFLVWMGGNAVFNHNMEFGVLYAFISYIRLFFNPINQITQQWNVLQSTLVSVERLWQIFAVKPDVKEADPEEVVEIDPSLIKGKVDFNHIQFAYLADRDVLKDLDLHINPGEFVGIVGTTGAGKSSLVNLLARFYDVKQGSIEIDGVDIRKYRLDALHRLVGLVQQEPFLYSGSIMDNVRLFNQTISKDEVIQVCKIVGAHPMIHRLKNGYDSRLSERGSGLSAGERQLISFARILLYKPKILILDEATANLDSHSERMIQRALQVVSEGRTTLVIAHRLSTIQHANRIIVMRNGSIEEEGNHEELLEQNGYYAELCRHSRRGHLSGEAL